MCILSTDQPVIIRMNTRNPNMYDCIILIQTTDYRLKDLPLTVYTSLSSLSLPESGLVVVLTRSDPPSLGLTLFLTYPLSPGIIVLIV